MKLAALKKEWIQILILAVPFCAVILLWDRFPGWVPIHWNARGEVDAIGRKTSLFLLPFLSLGTAVLMGLLPFLDPKLRKYDGEMRASLWRTIKILRLAISGFLSLVGLAMMAAALRLLEDVQFAYIICIGCALLLAILGNYMGKLKPNYFVGIRTPWTLESKEVWAKTHRVTGRLMMLGGILMVLLCLVLPLEQMIWVILPISLGSVIFSFVYSYVIYKRNGAAQSVSS